MSSKNREFDPDYTGRLLHHVALLLAWESGEQGLNLNELHIAVAFLEAHCSMLAHELKVPF